MPVILPAVYLHQQTVRMTLQAQPESRRSEPWAIASAEMPQQQNAQPASQNAASAQTGSTAAGSSQQTVYGAYVPYTPPVKTPANGQAGQAPAATQRVVLPAVYTAPQPATPPPATSQQGQSTPPKTTAPAQQPQADTYGPYVPYKPPPPVPVQLGNTPPTAKPAQSEVTDVLPTAKYVPNAKSGSTTSAHPDIAAANAAAARRRQSNPRLTPTPTTGQSTPPAEEYSTSPTEPAQYTGPQQQVTRPGSQIPASQPTGASTSAPQSQQPSQTGDSYGQQYPQPNTRSTGVAAPATRGRVRSSERAAAPVAQPAAAPPPVYQGLSYPGVGAPLSYQPYPLIGPAVPLGQAPTDADLVERRLPPLRGNYYTGEPLQPQVPLTERQQTELDLSTLESSYSPWLGGTASARYRSGTVGLDRLTDIETSFEASAVVGNNVRLTIVPKAVFLNSGALNTTNSTNTNPVLGTLPGNAINTPPQQFANGVGGELQLSTRNFAAAIGYTPYEFLVDNVTGRVLYKPDQHFTFYGDRSAVIETQLSYAGLRDPGSATPVFSGNIWGGVVSSGGGIRYDQGDERAGFYITVDGAALTGYHTLENYKFEGSAGAYFLAHTFPGVGRLNIGASLFGMHYEYNELGLTYGLGGYFSPEAYFLASVPVTFVGRYRNNFHYSIAGAVGVQTFQEDNENFFPLDPGLQNGIVCTNAQLTTHSCGQTPATSNTSGNYSINTEGAYRINQHWYAGGFLSANNTNNYNTVTGGFFIRYLFRPQYGNEDYPTGLFPVEGFRPLRVP